MVIRMTFNQYDKVLIRDIKKSTPYSGVLRKRPPKINDIATIVEIYKTPSGFELECVNDKGETEWIEAFSQDEIEMEFIGRSA